MCTLYAAIKLNKYIFNDKIAVVIVNLMKTIFIMCVTGLFEFSFINPNN